ncbi:hypothetical protein B0H15DRAFT_829841 [Mycena belliarum]|uniref:DUF6534 domain-containing protein n=1 Tax=Mycena belliarum TaxID=1033014 RepID=A0AAD6UAQ9_9AGAR|nr:hypothetical protein B0H15DRAFT_829841 [Mycena belliae]
MDGLLHSFCLGFVLALGLKYWEDAEDSLRKRFFVMTVVFLSIAQTILQDYKVWTVAVVHRPWAGSPLLCVDFFVNGAISLMCEAFYIRRCWKLTGKSPWALYPMIMLWMTTIGAQFYVTITLGLEFWHFSMKSVLPPSIEHLLRNTLFVFSYWVGGCTILDITVAAIMITCLIKSKTGLEASNSVVHRVILLTLETALLPSISMVIAVIIIHGAPNRGHNDDLILFFVFITAKLYAIGLLRTLNARAVLRERLGSKDLGRTSLSTYSWKQDLDQEGEKHETAGRRARTSTPPPETATTLRASGGSCAPTYISRYEGVPPEEIVEAPMTPAGSSSQHIRFGSPLLDRSERGSHSRLRLSSIHRPKPESK